MIVKCARCGSEFDVLPISAGLVKICQPGVAQPDLPAPIYALAHVDHVVCPDPHCLGALAEVKYEQKTG